MSPRVLWVFRRWGPPSYPYPHYLPHGNPQFIPSSLFTRGVYSVVLTLGVRDLYPTHVLPLVLLLFPCCIPLELVPHRGTPTTTTRGTGIRGSGISGTGVRGNTLSLGDWGGNVAANTGIWFCRFEWAGWVVWYFCCAGEIFIEWRE